MTKKYTHTYFGAVLKDGELFAYAESEVNARSICKELNKKDERIKGLEDKCEHYKQALLDLGINVKILDGDDVE